MVLQRNAHDVSVFAAVVETAEAVVVAGCSVIVNPQRRCIAALHHRYINIYVLPNLRESRS